MQRLVAPALSLLVLATGADARADLESDAARIAARWKERGAKVVRGEPIFVEHGHARRVKVVDPGGACLTVAFVGVRTAELSVATERAVIAAVSKPDPSKPVAAPIESRVKSAGGVAVIGRCGDGKRDLADLVVDFAAGRGAVEIVVAGAIAAMPDPSDVLPERAPGISAPRGDAGGPLEPGPLADRVARADKRAHDAGAASVTHLSMHSNAMGLGEFDVKLSEGCHRVELFAEVPATVPRRATDLDAEAHLQSGRVLARDRADVPDVRLDFCVGETSEVEIPYVGASGAVNVTFADARFPIAASIPSSFGARARAGFAAALSRRKGPDPSSPPIFLARGVQATTIVPIAVAPNHCYLVGAAAMRGETRKLRLTARVGDRAPRDETADRTEGVAIAFCARSERSVRLEVDAAGSAPWWALAVWPMGSVTR